MKHSGKAIRAGFRLIFWTLVLLVGIFIVGVLATVVVTVGVKLYERLRGIIVVQTQDIDPALRSTWRMPPTNELPPAQLSLLNRLWMAVLRGYLVVAAGMLLYKIVQLAIAPAG